MQNTKDEFASIQKDMQEICSNQDLSDDSVSLRATEKNDESVVQDIDEAIVEEDTYRWIHHDIHLLTLSSILLRTFFLKIQLSSNK